MKYLIFFLLLSLLPGDAMIYAQEFSAGKMIDPAYTKLQEARNQYTAAAARHASRTEMAELAYILGKRYLSVDATHKTRYWLLKALEMRSPDGPSEDIGKIYGWLGGLEFTKRNTDSAMSYVRKALFNFQAAQATSRLIGIYAQLGDIHATGWKEMKAGKKLSFEPSLDSAFFYCEKALAMALSQNRTLDIGLMYAGLAGLWNMKKVRSKEILMRNNALQAFRRGKFYNNEFLTLLDLAGIYISENKPYMARQMLDEARSISDRFGDIRHSYKAKLEMAFASYYQMTHEWEKAFEHQRKSTEYREGELATYKDGAEEGTTFLLENERQEGELKAKKLELALRQEKLETQTKLNLIIGLLLLFAGIAGAFYFRLSRKFKKISQINAELVLEQSHRIKNNLQSVSDLLSLQRYRISDPEAIQAMDESLLRIDAISFVHSRLYQGNNLVEVSLNLYLPDIVENVLKSYDMGTVSVCYDLQDLTLPVSRVISLGIMVNELATNACKYAFTHNPEPALRVTCKKLSEKIMFTFSDNGSGFDQNKEHNSFGLKLIDLMLVNLDGEGNFDTSHGTLFSCSFAMSKPV